MDGGKQQLVKLDDEALVTPGPKLATRSVDALHWDDGAGARGDRVRGSEKIAGALGFFPANGDGGEIREQKRSLALDSGRDAGERFLERRFRAVQETRPQTTGSLVRADPGVNRINAAESALGEQVCGWVLGEVAMGEQPGKVDRLARLAFVAVQGVHFGEHAV